MVALIRAGHRTHTATEEAARTRLGLLRLTKGGQASTYADRAFAELAHERFYRPRPTAVSGPLDALRQATSTERLKSAFTPPVRLLPAQPYPKPSRPAVTPRAGTQPPTIAKQQLQRQHPHAHPPPQNRATPHGHHPRNDGVARRADSCSPSSPFIRHCVRRRWRGWERIGASGQVLSWIRHCVRVKFKQGTRPRPFNHGTSILDATQAQLEFLDSELPRFEAYGAWERAYNSCYVSRMSLVPNPVTTSCV
jgi:hypothetical protein